MIRPTSIVIFGASGDLTSGKLVPALFNLFRKKRLPLPFHIVGTSRTHLSHEQFREKLRPGAVASSGSRFDPVVWKDFLSHLYYIKGDATLPEDHAHLEIFLKSLEKGPANRLFHLATAPSFFCPIAYHLGRMKKPEDRNLWRRIVIEKPFGHDLLSAKELNREVQTVFNEDQIYRIDHYLGKETAQNILFFRFANTIFEPVWNRTYVDHVQILVSETADVSHRASFYDQTGILRDMFQNHLMQLLALVAMEPPAMFDADAVRHEKVKLLSTLRPILPGETAKHTVRGQYTGYRKMEGISPDSQTETFAVVRLFIDNWRWQGIPFYLKSGKAMDHRSSEIIIQFRRPPHLLFPLPRGKNVKPNLLALSIQPDESMHLRFEVKVPDRAFEMRSVDMEYHYRDTFDEEEIPDAYERLLLDAIQGDASLFTRSDAIELQWAFIDPILKGWKSTLGPPLHTYSPGTSGPAAADNFIRKDKREWVCVCGQNHHL